MTTFILQILLQSLSIQSPPDISSGDNTSDYLINYVVAFISFLLMIWLIFVNEAKRYDKIIAFLYLIFLNLICLLLSFLRYY